MHTHTPTHRGRPFSENTPNYSVSWSLSVILVFTVFVFFVYKIVHSYYFMCLCPSVHVCVCCYYWATPLLLLLFMNKNAKERYTHRRICTQILAQCCQTSDFFTLNRCYYESYKNSILLSYEGSTYVQISTLKILTYGYKIGVSLLSNFLTYFWFLNDFGTKNLRHIQRTVVPYHFFFWKPAIYHGHSWGVFHLNCKWNPSGYRAML